MILDFVMLADSAMLDQSTGKLDVIGGAVGHVRAPQLPFKLPAIYIVLRFFLDPGDEQQEARLAVQVRDPDETSLFSIEGLILGPGVPSLTRIQTHAGEDPGLVVIVRIEGLVFEKYGRHAVNALLNAEPLVTRHIAVVPEHADHSGGA